MAPTPDTFIRASASPIFLPGLTKVLMNLFATYPWRYKGLFHMNSSTQKQEDFYRFNGLESIPEKDETALYETGHVSPGEEVTFTHLTYAYGLRYSLEAQEDELYGVIKQFPQWLFNATRHTIETVAHLVLNNGFTNTGYDSTSLFADDHGDAIDGTPSNIPATHADLGYTALQNALVAISLMETPEGHPMGNDGNLRLVYNPTIDPMVQKLLNTHGKEPFTANNTMNYVEGSVTPWASKYITDTTHWSLIPSAFYGGLMFYWRKMPYTWEGVDTGNGDLIDYIRLRCSAGYAEWRRTYASKHA